MLKYLFFIITSFVFVLPVQVRAEQYSVFSEACPAGDEEAQKLFKEAQDNRFGRGVTVNLERAVTLYNEAAEKGSIRALFDLGTLYEQRPSKNLDAEDQEKIILDFYTRAANAGCPEAMHKLYLWVAHHPNHSPKQNLPLQNASLEGSKESWKESSNKLLQQAANAGSMEAMYELGREYLNNGNVEKGTAWLQRALDLGYGDAAEPLSRLWFEQKEMRKAIGALREGARLGSIRSLHRLSWIYSRGQYNQMRDAEYAKCFSAIIDSINPDAPPELISNLDELCPPRRVFKY